ncbi:MAG: hypothetical protein A2V66_11500 [Ignavibacteria bacterium RBG_13_36_8]|nr:MAG: hypothetical protein A2V66_11500 [Ignavibacteria bacterium RBG_13_36_8]
MILAGFYLLIYSSCETVKEEPDYTYAVDSVWWSDALDGNQDGYTHYKRLNFNLRLEEQVTSIIRAQVYYKRHEASNYSFYAFSEDFEVNGGGVSNNLYVSVGAPNRELSRGVYDFSLEVYEASNDRLEAAPDSLRNLALLNQAFEESAGDKSLSIIAWWSDEYDRNNNGYWRNARLNLDFNVDEDVTKNVTAIVYYKDAASDVYSRYYTFATVTIQWNNADTVSCLVGSGYDELSHGQYDFRVDLYETGSSVLSAFIDQETDILNDVEFESEDDDGYFYSIKRTWWTDNIDIDSDSFTRYRVLNFDIDVDKNEEREIFAKIFFRHQDSTDYSIYDSTDFFSITGVDTSDYLSWLIGYPMQIDSAEYDFLITVFENITDTLRVVEASTSGYSDTNLARQKFETILQDTP